MLRNVAGITFQAGEGGVPAGDQLTIRGFSARTDMFIDGVRDFGGYSRDAFNLEQVEVTKGPSSSIAGRGSTGGSINQVTKAPQLGASYDGALGVGNAAYKRTTHRHQPAARRARPEHRVPPERDVDRHRRRRTATTSSSERWGVAPSLGFGLGTPTRADPQLPAPRAGQPARVRPALGAGQHQSASSQQYSNGMPPVDQSNFYGLHDPRLREHRHRRRHRARSSTTSAASSTLRNLTRYGQNDRDSVITAPRFASVNTSTAINRQLQSRDMVDDIVANQTNADAALRTGPAARTPSAPGLEFTRETSENFARTGPTAPTADLFNPNPNDPYPGPITRTGASTDGTADSRAAYAFDTVSTRRAAGSSPAACAGIASTSTTTRSRSTGVVTPFERTDDDGRAGARGAVYKPRPNGSIYLGYGTSFNPSAEGLALSAATVAPRAREDAHRRGRHQVGRDARSGSR